MTTILFPALLLVPTVPLPLEVTHCPAPLKVSAELLEDGRLLVVIPTQIVKRVAVTRLARGRLVTEYKSVNETVYRKRFVPIDRVRAYEDTGEMTPERIRDIFKIPKRAVIVADFKSPNDVGPAIVLVVQGWKPD